MAKYNCLYARDFMHEVVRLFEKCDEYTASFCPDCPLFLKKGNDTTCLKEAASPENLKLITGEGFRDMVKKLQEWSDSNPERRKLTDREITILKALRTLNYKYIAKDKSGTVYAYISKPVKYNSNSIWDLSREQSAAVADEIFDEILSFEDEEPMEIIELLKEEENGNA